MKTRILLVDPSADDREPLRSLLVRHHYVVETASTAEEALAKGEWAHLAILELRLEDGTKTDFSGERLATLLKDRRIPCVFYTKELGTTDTERLLASKGGSSLAEDVIFKDAGAHAVLDSAQAIIRNLRLDCPVIIHVSDLHFEPGEANPTYDQERSRKELINDLKALNLQRRVISLVVSGDISNMCLEGSWDAATEFLKGLAEQLRIPKEHIILTPGNHDINRFKALDAKRNIDYRVGRGVSTEEDSILFRKFEDFLKFTEAFYNEPAFKPDKLWRTFGFPDSNLVVVALNSSVREGNPEYQCPKCGKGHYYGWLGAEQIKGAAREIDLDYDSNVTRIAVFHHHALPREPRRNEVICPADCLWDYEYDSDAAKKRLADGGFKLLLHGHQHKARLSIDLNEPIHDIFGSGTLLIRNTGEAAVGMWDNKYLIVDLSSRQGESHVLMRKYDPTVGRGKWVPDGESGRIALSDIKLQYT